MKSLNPDPGLGVFTMSVSGAELLRRIKSQIQEVDPSEVNELIGEGVTIVDVRGSEEFATGHLPGAKSIPRGHLEARIESAAPDRSAELILYCASGNRSAYAARTLQDDLGYERVRSMTGGITLWKDRGYEVRSRARSPPSSATATRATCSCRRSAPTVNRSCS